MSLSSSLTCPQLAGSGSATRCWIVATVPCLRNPGTRAPANAEKKPLAIASMMLCKLGKPRKASGATSPPPDAAEAAGANTSITQSEPATAAGSNRACRRKSTRPRPLRDDPADRREDRKADQRLDRHVVRTRMPGHEHDPDDRDHQAHRGAAEPYQAALDLFDEVLHPGDRCPFKCTGRVQRVRVRVGEYRDNGGSDHQSAQCADGQQQASLRSLSTGERPSECERHHWPHLLCVRLQAMARTGPLPSVPGPPGGAL